MASLLSDCSLSSICRFSYEWFMGFPIGTLWGCLCKGGLVAGVAVMKSRCSIGGLRSLGFYLFRGEWSLSFRWPTLPTLSSM